MPSLAFHYCKGSEYLGLNPDMSKTLKFPQVVMVIFTSKIKGKLIMRQRIKCSIVTNLISDKISITEN